MALSALARVALASALASVAAAGAAETAAAAVASQERADSAASNSANKLVTADLSEGKFKEAAAHFWAASNKASVHTTTAMTKALADFAAWLETEGGQVSLVEAQAAAEAADATPASTAAATDAAAADAQSKAGSQTAAATQGVATTLSLTTDAQDAAIKRLKAAYEQAGGGMDGAGALLGEANDVLSVVNAYALQAISSGVVKDKAEIAERAKAAESFDDKAAVAVDSAVAMVSDISAAGKANAVAAATNAAAGLSSTTNSWRIEEGAASEAPAAEAPAEKVGWMPFAQTGAETGAGFAAQGLDTGFRFFTDPSFDFQKEGQAYQASSKATADKFASIQFSENATVGDASASAASFVAAKYAEQQAAKQMESEAAASVASEASLKLAAAATATPSRAQPAAAAGVVAAALAAVAVGVALRRRRGAANAGDPAAAPALMV